MVTADLHADPSLMVSGTAVSETATVPLSAMVAVAAVWSTSTVPGPVAPVNVKTTVSPLSRMPSSSASSAIRAALSPCATIASPDSAV